jgi:hypothetical protein
MRTNGLGLVFAMVVATLASPVRADEMTSTLTSASVITDGAGAYRVLFRAPGLNGLTDVAVRRAELTIPVAGATARETLRLQVSPVTTSWSAGSASWSSGWSRAGGDFDEELAVLAEVDLAAGSSAAFDVTVIVKELLESGAAFDGFILSVQPRDGTGLSETDAGRFQSLSEATLTVEYRNVPARAERIARARSR